MIKLTPPMGWNSWNTFGENINEKMIFESLLSMHGLNMQIERDGEIIATVPGLPNRETATNRQYVGFCPIRKNFRMV